MKIKRMNQLLKKKINKLFKIISLRKIKMILQVHNRNNPLLILNCKNKTSYIKIQLLNNSNKMELSISYLLIIHIQVLSLKVFNILHTILIIKKK
jgi:hypothetical protein